MKQFLLALLLLPLTLAAAPAPSSTAPAANARPAATPLWNGKRAAVVLTYDDALNEHLDIALPALKRYGLKGTFYISADGPGFSQRIKEWRAAAALGHELGNHTLFHPCDGSIPGRGWVAKDRDLSRWSVKRFMEEVQMTSVLLEAVDGKKTRTFAYTCGDKNAGRESLVPEIKALFPAARGVQEGMEYKTSMDLYDLRAISGMGQSGADLKAAVDRAVAKEALLIFLFHGVGGGHSLNVSKEAHEELLAYLAKQSGKVWVGPLVDLVAPPKKNK